MKLFEYLAIGVPIVASDTPALQSILSPEDAVFYEPDNVESLVRAVSQALHKERQVPTKVRAYSWSERGKRILSFIKNHG